MIIVKLMGGLGNQMFQYAFGKYLATKNDTELKLDTTFLLDRTPQKKHFVFRDYDLSIFNIDEQFSTSKETHSLVNRTGNSTIDRNLNKLLSTKKSYVKDMGLKFKPNHLSILDNTYIEGYWQSEKYFHEISNQLKQNCFTFKSSLSKISAPLIDKITNSNSVCINIRRGDFVVNSFHGALGVSFYKEAEKILLQENKDLEFFIFSDDIEWCENNLKFSVPTTFIGHEFAGHKFQDYLRLMSACKHFIIPNSSFAWWAVWFSSNTNKIVIAPKNWINNPPDPVDDLVPKDWIRI
ncbi:MAG: alpha-1,2-fucosyltransferase [Flavobacteriales bacterium]|nr:alpha-1,2-fucosyltransferase [Flavobacteriales bacterium]